MALRSILYSLAILISSLSIPLPAFCLNDSAVPMEAIKSLDDVSMVNFNLRKLAQESGVIRKLLYRSQFNAPVSSITVLQSTFTTPVWAIYVESDGALSLTSVSSTTAVNYQFIPLSPYIDQAYFFRVDSSTDGAFETNRVNANVYFPDLLIENRSRAKVYSLSTDSDGALRADLWASY